MTDKEKIEAELERLKYAFNQDADIASAEDAVGEKIAQAKYELCCTLLDFSNSLPEEPASEDLEEEYHRFLQEEWFNKPGKTVSEMMFLTAKHFAQRQKEQMMSNAIDGKVLANGMGNPILHLWDKGRHLIDKRVKVIVIEGD